MDKETIEYWIAAYNRTGHIAFYHPRKDRISLNGRPSIPVAEAISKIKECLRRAKEKSENGKLQKSKS